MKKYRKELERIKRQARAELEANTVRFSRAIVREVGGLIQRYDITEIDDLADVIRKRFHLPSSERAIMDEIVTKAQADVTNVWNDYFTAHQIGYEGIKVIERIDFGQLRSDHQAAILTELKLAAARGLKYSDVRANLIKKGVGAFNATTLANTAISKYSNGYMHEVCDQAGIEKFLYDGMPARRPFCQQHLGQVYTRAEIEEMNNGQGLDVMTSLGGYNCVHFWTPVIE